MTPFRHLIPALALAAAAVAGPALAATQIADGGFETQGSSVAPGGYCYFGMATGGGPACGAGAWQGVGAGLQDETNQPWPGQPTDDGSKYGFVQGLGELAQVFTADTTGAFTLSWMDAGRPRSGGYDGNQTYDVLLVSNFGADTVSLGSFATTDYQPFTARSTGLFNLAAGETYALVFRGTGDGDHTSFIDGVSLAGAVPEPASWALMLLGFSGLGATLRASRRRLVLATA